MKIKLNKQRHNSCRNLFSLDDPSTALHCVCTYSRAFVLLVAQERILQDYHLQGPCTIQCCKVNKAASEISCGWTISSMSLLYSPCKGVALHPGPPPSGSFVQGCSRSCSYVTVDLSSNNCPYGQMMHDPSMHLRV